jgi:TatD DNase family protein|tara:strand:+ start:29535 stop:30305 length:771 start_codon:yes stop_codon:yes gene_type:complete
VFVDSHCHLDHLDLEPYNNNLDLALNAARGRGVHGFLLIGIDFNKFQQLIDIELKYSDVWMSIGCHPLGDETHLDKDKLAELASHAKVVALGETGLDYHYAPEKKEFQKAAFEAHMQVASDLQKPLIIHSRSAVQDTLELMQEYRDKVVGVLHCFTEDWQMAKAAIDMGYYISLSGIVTFRNADALREVAKKIPADRLLIETDSPWLAPVPHRGKQNEPKYLPEIAKCIADLRNTTIESIGETTTENFHRLFQLAS